MPKFVRLFLPLFVFGVVAGVTPWLAPDTGSVLIFFLALMSGTTGFLFFQLAAERLSRRRLETQKQLYVDSFERSNVGIAHASENGVWIRVNPRFAEILGQPRERLIGRDIHEWTHPADRAGDAALTRQLWLGEIPSFTQQKRIVMNDGSIRWILLSATLTAPRPGQRRYMIRSIKDVSAWKQAEVALSESSLQLRMATDAAQLGIWEYDGTSETFTGNPILWAILGLSDPGPGGSPEVGKRVHPADQELIRQRFEEAIAKVREYIIEYRFIKPDGTVIWLESIGSPLRNAAGEVTRFLGVTRDITERKLAQIDFQRSVDVSPAILWITEVDGQCTYLSQQWYAFTGQKKGEALGFGWLDAVHPEDREGAGKEFLNASARRAVVYIEYRLRTAAGAYRWVIDSGNPRYDADGTYLGYAGAIFDVHDAREAQSRVEAAAAQFSALANSIPQLAWMANPDGSIHWYNDRWITYSGLTPETMKGFGWTNVHHPDHVDRVVQKYRDSLHRGEVWEDTFPLRSASGEWRWFLSRAIPIRGASQEIVQWFGTNTDITDLREYQNAVSESEARFRDLANSMPQLVWTADAQGQVDYYNDRAAEYEGFGRDATGRWSWQPGLHPDDLTATIEAWQTAVAEARPYVCEHRVRMRDGGYRWHLSRALPVLEDDGRVKRWYGTATNIHEYKLAAVELAKAKQLAEDANRAKSRFLANMSHEIRSPMSSVLGYADLLLERGLSDADRAAYAASIKASGGHLLAIIDDILDLSAVESGEFKIDPHPFAMIDLLRETLKSMAVLAERKGLDLQVEFETPVPSILDSDPLRFRQILLNLLSNAIKFTERGHIIVRLSHEDERLRVEVEDSGVGIQPDKAHKLFRAFSQVDSSISRQYGGTGLGLHLSRRLAQALDGDLTLKWSGPGRGSCFVLELPVEANASPLVESFRETRRAVAQAHSEFAPSPGQYAVLLAEDSHDNQILITIFLKKLGARVDIANNGEEAIRLATSGHYDIVLMDMMMPVMDGLEATRRLRSLGYQRPIVALTAHALKEEVDKSIDAGCDLHLSKPIQIDVLRRTIELLLHARRDANGMDSSLH